MLPPERPTTEPEADEPTDWQREMAASIRKVIEGGLLTNIAKRSESTSVCGDGYATDYEYDIKPVFHVLVDGPVKTLIDHIPVTVESVRTEPVIKCDVVPLTVDCRLVDSAVGLEFWHARYKCSVVE